MPLFESLTTQNEDEILKEVNYSRAQLDADLVVLKEWLGQQHHLPPSRLKEPDCFLRNYLAGCKGSLETAKRKLDAYYTYRSHSELFDNRDPLKGDYKEWCKTCYTFLLPKLNKSREVIMVVIPLDPDSKNYNFFYHMRRIMHIMEMKLRMEEGFCTSITYIVDSTNFSPGHVLLFKPSMLCDIMHLCQDILPCRIKTCILVNAPTFMEIAMNNLVKPFLSKKLKERFFVYSTGTEEFLKYVDSDVLPKELGGTEPATLQELNEAWLEKEISERDLFIGNLTECTDETKRINLNGEVIGDPYFGAHGSLKKLVLD